MEFSSAQMAFPYLTSRRMISGLKLWQKTTFNFLPRFRLQYSRQPLRCPHPALSFRQSKIRASQASPPFPQLKKIFYYTGLSIALLLSLLLSAHGFAFIIRLFSRFLSFFLALSSPLMLAVFYLTCVCLYSVLNLSTDTNIFQLA